MLIARQYLIRGRVQGVGFRFFVAERAADEGLSGNVRNLRDGRVEVRVEGESEAVSRFELALHRGPSGARVEGVDHADAPPTGRHLGFSVRD